MTSPADPPLVRERASIRTLRSIGTFQIVFGVLFVVLAVVGVVNSVEGWRVAIAVAAGVLIGASGFVARRVARRRLDRFEAEHGVGAGVLRRPAAAEATDAGEAPDAADHADADDAHAAGSADVGERPPSDET